MRANVSSAASHHSLFSPRDRFFACREHGSNRSRSRKPEGNERFLLVCLPLFRLVLFDFPKLCSPVSLWYLISNMASLTALFSFKGRSWLVTAVPLIRYFGTMKRRSYENYTVKPVISGIFFSLSCLRASHVTASS